MTRRLVPSSTFRLGLHVSALGLLTLPAAAGDRTVDGFEAYPSTAELREVWSPLVPGEPSITLDTGAPRTGEAAMLLDASTVGGPVDVARLEFAESRDWSGFNALYLWIRGASTPPASVQVVLASAAGTTVATGPELHAPPAGWIRYKVDIAGPLLADIGSLSVAIRPLGDEDAAVLVDDIALSADPLVFDVRQTAQPLLGFGAQTWPGDASGELVLDTLAFRWARIAVGPNWDNLQNQPPMEATPHEMNAYVAANFNGDFSNRLANAVGALEEAEDDGVSVILNQFKIPDVWLTTEDRLRTSNLDEFAEYWAAVLSLLDDNGVRPQFVELANEPNGTWNGRITPEDYSQLVTLARQQLDAAGFTDVGIVGPGLSQMRLNDDYFNALDAQAVSAMAAWSTHTWDDQTDWQQRFGVFADGVDQVDPDRIKPIFITEYATSKNRFGDVNYDDNDEGGPDPASDVPAFAIEVVRNTVRLLNGGAGAMLYWEAADQPFNELTWGLRDRSGNFRPAINALFPIVNNATPGSFALRNETGDPTVAALLSPGDAESQRVTVILVNQSDQVRTSDIAVEGALVERIAEAWVFSDSGLQNITGEPSIGPAGDIAIAVPTNSAATVAVDVVEPAPCTSDFNGDGQRDFFDVLEATERFRAGDPALDRRPPAGLTASDLIAAVEAALSGCEGK